MNRALATVVVLALVLPAASHPASTAPATVETYPTVVGDHVDPAAHSHWPVRVRKLERIAWTFSEGEHSGMPVPAPGGLVYIQAGGGGVRAVEAETGKRVWIGPGNWSFFNYSSCVVGPDGAAYGGNMGFVSAVEKDGTPRWRADLDASWIHRPPALSPDGKRLYLGSDTIGVACLDAATGHVSWLRRDFVSPWTAYAFDSTGGLVASVESRLVCFAPDGKERWAVVGKADGVMFAGSLLLAAQARTLRAFDSDTRSLRWTREFDADIGGIALGDDGRIVVSLQNGAIASVTPAGALKGVRRISDAALARPVTAAGGETLVCDMKGVLYLCDADGQIVSQIDTGGAPYRWRPAVGRDGRVYLAHSADVVCIDGAVRTPP